MKKMEFEEEKQCIICLENCKKPLKLDLDCECKYVVHYKCFNTWWKRQGNCIICKTECNKHYIRGKKKKNIIRKRQNRIPILNPRNPELLLQIFEGQYINHNAQVNMIVCSKILQIFFYLLVGLIVWIVYTTI
jgi:hypothetical protein